MRQRMKNMNFIVATCILKINQYTQYAVDCKRAIEYNELYGAYLDKTHLQYYNSIIYNVNISASIYSPLKQKTPLKSFLSSASM
jgi:hypothetical protein